MPVALIRGCSSGFATGTPGGVGAKRQPPLWMKEGDIVEVEIPKVGLLVNRVQAERDNS